MNEALSFGPWLKQRRRILDLTQHELADRAACSLSTLRKIEGGDLLPSKELAQLLAVAVGVPAAEQEAFIAFARDERRAVLNPALFTPPTAPVAPLSVAVQPTPPLHLPEAPALPARRGRVPAQLTPFIGRDLEVTELHLRLRDPACRLLTLVGPGGIGKTRLALAVAQAILDFGFGILDSAATGPTDNQKSKIQNLNFSDGVYFISFVGVTAPEFMVSTIANALGFTFAGAGDAKAQLLAYLADKQLLLVLDNLEQLLDGVDLLIDLLETAPSVKIFVTSRQRLNLMAEWVITLEGLTVPPSTALGQAPESALTAYSAVNLFLLHARRVKANFQITGEEVAIARICQLVGGMPLAIEMATAWLRLLTCQQIEAKIREDLAFLTQPGSTIPARHRSIHAVFDYSWRLLQAEEQQLFAQLAVFRGGFTAAAAIQVAGATLLTLASLIDHSLLRQTAEGRYDLHELVRQYAEEKLRAMPAQYHATGERHCTFFADLIATHEQALTLGQRPAFVTLRADVDNLRAAWRWAIVQHNPAHLARMVIGFLFFYGEQSWFGEGVTLFDGSLQEWRQNADSGNEARLVQAQLLLGKSYLQIIQGHYHEASNLTDSCQLLFQEMGDPRALALCLFLRGIAATHNGQLTRTKPLLLAALEQSEGSGFLYGIGATNIALGDLARAYGDLATAEECYRTVLQLSRRYDSVRGNSLSLTRLGALAKLRGDYAQAERLFQEGLQVAQPRNGEGGDLWSAAENLWRQAEVALAQGKLAEARAGVQAALRRATQMQNNLPAVLAAITVAGQLCCHEGQLGRAVEYLTLAHETPITSLENKATAQQLLTDLQQRLAPDQLAQAQALGRARTLAVTTEEILAW